MRKTKAGFVGFGEVNTPREFIDKRAAAAAAGLEEQGFELIKAPTVSDDPDGITAEAAYKSLAGHEFDVLILCVAGWIPSWAVFKVIEPFKHKPMVLWGLSGGAYLEFYEFMKNGALMGVPDYVPAEIIDGPIAVMPTAFGDFGEGLLNVSGLKTGKVTLARLGGANGEFTMHAITAEAKAPIKWEEAGWTPPAPQLPSLDIIFDGPTDDFIRNVMSQHYIISYGDNLGVIRDFCKITGINMV